MGRCSDARERLVGTAVRLFHERGYTAVSVADICDAAGLKKGSFYHFFPSKLELVLEALDHYGQFYERVVNEGLTPGRPARAQLEAMFAALFESVLKGYACEGKARGCPIGNLALELADREEPIRHKIELIFAKLRNAFESIIRRGIERGELAAVDPRAAAEGLMAMVQGAMVLTKTANDPQVFARLVDVTISALAPSSHPSAPTPPSSTAPMSA
jgi:TetR/AcrR family transcriptional regulator, transcriptional repressor for nem operon